MKENNVQPGLNAHEPVSKTAQTRESDLRQQRMDELLENIQQSVLQQIIGPFGLTPAMFDDKDGGDVTTQHNAEKGIFAKKEEEYNRQDYDYSKAKKEKMEEQYKKGELNSQEFKDAYTGEWVPATRARNSDGKIVKNFELDHLKSLKEIHGEGGWMQGKEERGKLSSNKDNLHYTTMKNNRSKGAKSAGEFLSEENGYDQKKIQPLIEKAEESIKEDLPSTWDRAKYHAEEIGIEGAKNALGTAKQQAIGVLLFELVSGCIAELKQIFRERNQGDGIIKRIVQSLTKFSLNKVIFHV